MKLRFVVPDPEMFLSGGNLYNANLVRTLKGKGINTQMIDFEQFVACEREGDTFYFIDTLYLDDVRKLDLDLERCFLIVHHLESLYPGKEDPIEVFETKERPFLTRFEGFLTSSEYTKQYLLGKGLLDHQYIVTVPGLCIQPKVRTKPDDFIKAIIVSNLMERKGIYPFLKSLQQHKIDPEKCQIQIVGTSDIEPEYAKKCIELINSDEQLSKVVSYAGSLDSSKIQSKYELSNLFISLSFMETFGMALQEAVAYRLPILAFDGGNVSYHVEEQNGFLFSSIEELVTKLNFLSNDNLAFKKLIESTWGFRKFEKYSWEDAANVFLQKINHYVAGRI